MRGKKRKVFTGLRFGADEEACKVLIEVFAPKKVPVAAGEPDVIAVGNSLKPAVFYKLLILYFLEKIT